MTQTYVEARTDELRRATAEQKEMADLADADAAHAALKRAKVKAEVLDITDELLDEIEAVLLETGEIDFVQKGGE